MFIKPRDKENIYDKGILKAYTYWQLEMSYQQHTFGNYIIFCKREHVKMISELTDEELLELKTVFKEIEQALSQNPLFQPLRYNYWQMGNGLHHLHIHGIPRYDIEKEFGGKVWKDANHRIPVIRTYEKEDDSTIILLREEIKKFLP